MENQNVLQIVSQVLTLVRPKDTQGEADHCPQVYDGIITVVMITQLMNLGVAIVAAGNAIIGPGGLDLFIFYFPVCQALLLETGLQKTAAAATAIIVGPVGLHVDEVFFTYHGFNNKAQIFSDRIAV